LRVIRADETLDPHRLADLRAIRKSLNPASWNSLTKTSNRLKSMAASGEVCIFPQEKGSGSGLAIGNPIGAKSSASAPIREGLSVRTYSVPIRMGEADRGINVGPVVGSAVTVAEVETAAFVAEGPALSVAEGKAGVAEGAAVVGA
jgi:hypothetical protein